MTSDTHRGKAIVFNLVLAAFLVISGFVSVAGANVAASYVQGEIFGKQHSHQIMQNIKDLQTTAADRGTNFDQWLEYAKKTEALYQAILPEKIAWIKGAATGSGVHYDDLLVFNVADLGIKGFQGECTTVMAQGKALKAGKGSIIVKNRDLGTNTLSEVGLHQAAELPKNAIYKAAYIDIPNVAKTYKFIGSRTAGRWGYGMGINENQVSVADNDAPSRDKMDWKASLHDNDVVRLILERAQTAREGVEIATKLVETYGQAWNGIMFEIGDPNEIWVVEVTGRRWAAKQYKDTIAVRTNQYQLTDDYDLSSKDLISFAVEQGWVKDGVSRINFRAVYGTGTLYPDDNNLAARTPMPTIYSSQQRYLRAKDLMQSLAGAIEPAVLPAVMRDHYDAYTLPSGKTIKMDQVPFYSSKFADWTKREWVIDKPETDLLDLHMYVRGVCGHDIGWLRTASSAILVSRPDIPGDLAIMFHAYMNPCQSTYIPFFTGITELDPRFASWQAAAKFESIRTRAFGNYGLFRDAIRGTFDPYETEMFQEIETVEETYLALSNAGKKAQAAAALTQYVQDQCITALGLADEVQDKMSRAAYNSSRWSR